jgi:glycosyltransferase involved in cell wall biosynthesis
VVPAYNEVTRLRLTVTELVEEAEHADLCYQVIIVNDGSVDGTAEVAEDLARERPGAISVIHQPVNLGVGRAFLAGLNVTDKRFITLVPGDNAFARSGIARLFAAAGSAELIVTYRSNPQARTFLRRWLSRFATLTLRLISGRAVRDAHSMFIYPVDVVRQFRFSAGYGYHMETLSRMLLVARTVREIPVELNPKPDASSGVMKVRTLLVLGATAVRLLLLRITGRLVPRELAIAAGH